MKPSTLLKNASKLNKEQMTGAYRNETHDKYCAVGVMGCLLNKYNDYGQLDGSKLIDDLAGDIANINFEEEFGMPYRTSLFSTIVNLNDNYFMTFAEIADFLKVSCGL